MIQRALSSRVYLREILWKTICESALTIVAIVDIHAMAVVQALNRARQVDLQVEVFVVLLVADAPEVLEDFLVHVKREGRGRELLVVDRRVKREGLVDNLNDLQKNVELVGERLAHSLETV